MEPLCFRTPSGELEAERQATTTTHNHWCLKEPRSELPADVPADINWFTIPVPKTNPLIGYVAGPMYGVMGHWSARRSRPCVNWLSHGQQVCVRCKEAHLRHVVYLPLYTVSTFERVVIILSKTTYREVKGVQFGDLIRAQQHPMPRKPAEVRPIVDCTSILDMPADLMQKGPQDIWTYLTHLWGMAPKSKGVVRAARQARPMPPTADQETDLEHMNDMRTILAERIARRFPSLAKKLGDQHAA